MTNERKYDVLIKLSHSMGLDADQLNKVVSAVLREQGDRLRDEGTEAQLRFLSEHLTPQQLYVRLGEVLFAHQEEETDPLDDLLQYVVDEKRLSRSHELKVSIFYGSGHKPSYEVSGGREPHRVSARLECDCEDALQRGGLCKHLLAVLRHQGFILKAGAYPVRGPEAKV